MKKSRRTFLTQSAAVSAGFLGLGRLLGGGEAVPSASPYGPLKADPRQIFDLPEGFSYTILSRTGDRMSDGFKVPGQPDGMGAFAHGPDSVILVRNHEIGDSYRATGPFDDNRKLPSGFDPSLCFDPGRDGVPLSVGGTSTVVYNLKTRAVESQFLSLVGTDRNCAGGVTPWNTWITCEEPDDLLSQWGQFHGYNFEVPASAEPGLARPEPLRAMGRFRHEAIAVDPATGFLYQTEDRPDSVLYRFLPKTPGKLAAGGRLQALKIKGKGSVDTRNLDSTEFPVGERFAVEWIDLENIDTPDDDLRLRAAARGAAVFSRGEGMWFGTRKEVGEGTFYFACTDGGPKRAGQIFRHVPGENGGDGWLDLYLEPNDSSLLSNADNLTVAPTSGHLFICEDTKGVCHLRGVTREGGLFTFGRNAQMLEGKTGSSELTGVCFSPDGSTMFVNIQTPGITLAITGPFVS